MSLSNVLLLHVSTAFLPRNERERNEEQNDEYYHILDLPQYSSIDEIRRAYRRASLQLQCDRTMLEWNNTPQNSEESSLAASRTKLDEREQQLQKAYRVLGDRHLRQQYHLLQCRPSRAKVLEGSIAVYSRLTHTRRWFPCLVLQSVLVAAMVNATLLGAETQDWVLVLIPTWGFYSMTVLFWLFMLLKLAFWRRNFTWRSLTAMFSAFAQHASIWLGLFYAARYWDRDVGEGITWFILSIPFYLAIVFRCYCSSEAIRSLRELQTKMVSRKRFEVEQKKQGDSKDDNDHDITSNGSSNIGGGGAEGELRIMKKTSLPEEYIVVSVDSQAFVDHLQKLPLSDHDLTMLTSDSEKLEEISVQTSPEFRQVNQAVIALQFSILKLASCGTLFVALLTLKLEGFLPVSFWVVFIPVWIILGGQLICDVPRRRRVNRPSQNTQQSRTAVLNATIEESPTISGAAPTETKGTTETGPAVYGDQPSSGAHDNTQATSTKSAVVYDVEAGTSAPIRVASIGSGEANVSIPDANTDKKEIYDHNHHNLVMLDGEKADAANTSLRDATNGAEDNEESGRENRSGQGTGNVVHEFERWQSVYENTEPRSMQLRYIPCRTLFHILIVVLIVIKLDKAYHSNNHEDVGYDAFLIILVPFSVGLVLCCCAIMAGCIELAQEDRNGSRDSVNVAAAAELQRNENSRNMAESDSSNEQPAPMQAGTQNPRGLTLSTYLDTPASDFALSHRIQLLTTVLPITTADAEGWLVDQDTYSGDTRSLWALIIACSDELDCHRVNHGDVAVSNDFPSLSSEWWSFLRQNLEAYFSRGLFQSDLDAIRPSGEDEANSDDEEKQAGIECPICCEDYNLTDMVPCDGDPMHFFCRVCFHRYATETVDSGSITGMPCADAKCEATFATPTVRSNLSAWDILRIEDRENERNTKVALAAKAVLNCTCGAVGIVTEEELGDGCITCPGPNCNLQFCAKCGNKWHPDTNCPPTKKMLQWVVKNTMPCPNCHTPIEKNAGCDHMHCAPPVGCGHHFSYRTGKPMSKSGRNLRGLYT